MTGVLSGLPGWLVLLLVAGLLVVESGAAIGVVLPAATTVLAAGVVSGFGAVPAWALVLTAAGASAAGSHLGLLRGRTGGAVLAAVLRRTDPAVRDRVAYGLRRYDVPTLAACQMLAVLRTVAPRLSAVAGVSRVRHALGTAPAALLWATVLVGLGHSAGASYPAVERAVGLAGLPVVAAVVVIGSVVLVVRRVLGGRSR